MNDNRETDNQETDNRTQACSMHFQGWEVHKIRAKLVSKDQQQLILYHLRQPVASLNHRT
jgi:hypothetical protein